MTRYNYPHTIENGAGERLTFERIIHGLHGDRLEGHTVVDPGAGPPMHVHFQQEEGFTVQEGRLGYQRMGGQAFLMRRYRSEFALLAIPAPGQRILFPLLVAIGTALGKYRRYADAPVPVAGSVTHEVRAPRQQP